MQAGCRKFIKLIKLFLCFIMYFPNYKLAKFDICNYNLFMRLRHKKNAENDVLTHPFIISTHSETAATFDKQSKAPSAGVKHFNPEQIFVNKSPIQIELGMGKGKFIREMSKQNPSINFIGIERSATIVLKAIDHLGDTDLLSSYPNLRFMCEDIANLENIFEKHSIDKIFLNFSDPWPKKRHESRRLTHHKFLSIYENILKPDSLLEFKTDNIDLFNFSLEEIKNSNFKLLEFTYDLHNDAKLNEGNIMTEYEEKFSKVGNKICKLIAKV